MVLVREGVKEHAESLARSAAKLFANKGYDATSVREIVESAGLAKPSLYYYYGNKEGLAEVLLVEPVRALSERLRSILEAEPADERLLVRVIEAFLEMCREDLDRSRFAYSHFFGASHSSLKTDCSAAHIELFEVIAQAVQRLAEAAIVRREAAESLLLTFRGIILVTTLDLLYHASEPGPEALARMITNLIAGYRPITNSLILPS